MFQPQDQKEKSLQESKGDEDLQFCWGIRKGAMKLYESFTLDGIEYSLYDCVYVTESHEKKVEVVWFFRPVEVAHWLGDIKPLQREIFLACGHGKGLSNVDPLEVISGKCNVVCSSKHKRNPQPTEEELRMADYVFYHTFDVGKYIISEKFPSSIGGIEETFASNRDCSDGEILVAEIITLLFSCVIGFKSVWYKMEICFIVLLSMLQHIYGKIDVYNALNPHYHYRGDYLVLWNEQCITLK
ncbi:hypothetical protein Pfo_001903, partial [Paulownia fortunei]